MSQPLETAVQLHTCLLEARAAERLLAGLPDWMSELHAEHVAARAALDALAATAEAAAKERRVAEAAIADNQEKLKRFQAQMSLVRNQREYGALLQEIDTARAQVRKLEEQALAALEKADAAQTEHTAKQEAFAELEGRYQAALARWEAEKPQLAARLAEVRAEIDVLRSALPPGVRAQFLRLFERLDGNAIAPLRRVERASGGPNIWHCGACNFHVRPQLAVEIRSAGALVYCDSCKRLLFSEGSA